MIDFYYGEINDIMPYNLITPETKAVSFAVSQGMKKLQEYSQASHLYGEIKKVPEAVLDLLALELNTQYYEQTMPRTLKEGLIVQTTAWYMRSGTPGVLKEFLSAVLDGGEIKEWYQYNGAPFHFKAMVQVGEHEILPGYGTEIKRQIELYKNARSWLEYVEFIISSIVICKNCYDNALRFRNRFYPRVNTPYLNLDGFWKLTDKKLSGYDSDERIDFYPVVQKFQIKVSEDILPGSKMRIMEKIPVNHTSVQRFRLMGFFKTKSQEKNALRIRNEVKSEIKTGNIRVTTLNELTSEWSLDNSRTLNGGLAVL
jgi:P2-related tail formation protein